MSSLTGPVLPSLYQDIFRDVADAMIFSDVDGVIRLWNPAAEAVFGYTASEAIGQSLDLIIPESLREAHWRGYRQAMSRGATVHGRRSSITRSLHKSGQTLYVDMSFAVIRDETGKTIGSAAMARDATLRYTEEKRLRRQIAAASENAAK
ncbi:PAS domain S-box-containing protein [Paucimonas lemoignei]|uniref:PAS domain S-box-containing protein n=1 Tax=Paucimonas lemoignei TaxID=29443 RepID=A0A4R3I2S8_PAULE|nr:PAS domain S-box protein [Paucimonas lemoignei]TCS39333.1 PAS domain S-box-containing protein [Paucimonas lemoignei]